MKRFILFIAMLFSINFYAQEVTIPEARDIDVNGEMVLLDQEAIVEGISIGYNFRPGAITWAIYDTTANIGLSVFNVSDTLGYSFKPGDHLRIHGVLSQFNGLSQIVADSIELINEGNPVPEAEVILDLDENTESKLVRYENCELVDPSEWQSSGSFNVNVSNGITVVQLRIDSDTDISGRGAPTGVFNVTGMGGQFDNESPFFDGYQMFPRSSADFDPYNEEGVQYTPLSIDEANNTDAEGVAIYDGQSVELTGITLGINFRPTGLQFALVDEDNNGIGLFNLEGDLGYNFAQGDNITVQGVISQFNGLTQINPEFIEFNSSGNDLPTSLDVDELGENTESSFVRLNGSYTLVDPAQWLGDGSSYNVQITDGNDMITMRIDNDTEMSSMMAPTMPFTLHGIGGQFDTEAPFLDGYQILPRTSDDINETLNAEELISEYALNVFPNPARDIITVTASDQIEQIHILDITGKTILKTDEQVINISMLQSGNYILRIRLDDQNIHYPLSKK